MLIVISGRTDWIWSFVSLLTLSSCSLLSHPRGVEPYDPPTTVLVQRHEPQGVSTIISSTDFFQTEQNRKVILEQVDSFQVQEKYMFATTSRVRNELILYSNPLFFSSV